MKGVLVFTFQFYISFCSADEASNAQKIEPWDGLDDRKRSYLISSKKRYEKEFEHQMLKAGSFSF